MGIFSTFKDVTDNRLKIIFGYAFGFFVLGVYFTLALAIAMGHVEEKTSYGLVQVLTALGPLGGMFCGWAFGLSRNGKSKEEPS
jgi:hypothetical protein